MSIRGYPAKRALSAMRKLGPFWQDTIEYGPVTMIIGLPASGHQVRCMPWVQMGTFNREIGFLCGLKFFALNIFCGEYPQ